MKKYLSLFILLLSLTGCNNVVEKPDNLIEEDKMIDILHDLYIVEGIRQSDPGSFQERGLSASEYVYKKYKVDSLQFAKSDKWYASNIVHYGKMYEKIQARIDEERKALEKSPGTQQDKTKPADTAVKRDHFLRK